MIIQTELLKSLKTHGEKIAIENSEKPISYSQLLHISNQIAYFLLKEKLGKETVIGIHLKDRADIICSIIGILSARCTFVPIDGSLPENRLASMVQDMNLQYVITSEEDLQKSVINEIAPAIKYFFLEDILKETTERDINAIHYPEYNENDSIYIYFTSGSTGKPKGIVGKNCSLLQFIKWEIEYLNIDHTFRFSQFISPFFDAFLRDVFVPLIGGGTVCIPPAEKDLYSPEKIVTWIDKNKINVIHCVPSLFRLINNETVVSQNFENLKYVLLSGERIIPSELVRWYNIFGSRIQLVNLYGTTETTMIRSSYKIRPEDTGQAKIPIGNPIHDTELLIADKNFKPCSMLVPGDLYIVSNYCTKGYLNAPELTQEKFLVLNSGTPDEIIAFKTGDKARRLANGMIELIGREDRQIKLRGIRIELDEIENVLCKSELIKRAIVIQNNEMNENESLIAFVIKNNKPEGINLNKEIQLFLEKNLPEYMIPSRIVEVKEFPLLSNGKLNYIELFNCLNTSTIIAPSNEIETKVLSIWKEILGDKSISTDESFHSIGGNSLSIMRLIGKIYTEFNIRISLSELFNNFTIKQQAEFIKKSNKDENLIINHSELKAAYNLSSAQERIYYVYELNKASTAYNLPMAWKINGALDKPKIERALKLLIQRHESLRTEFRFENGMILQVVKDDVDFNLEEIYVQKQDLHDAFSKFVKAFDLRKAPLIRCGIIYAGEDQKILIVDLHHIICDGMSQLNLFSDFLSLYKGEVLKPISLQYKDYAEWEYNFKTTDEYRSYREFWLKGFEGNIPKLAIPTISSNKMKISDKGGNVTFKIDCKVIMPIIEVLKDEEITTFSGLFSIFFIYLFQLTGQEDLVIGINTSGRMQYELENIVGMFVKTLPIRFQIDTSILFKDFAKQLHNYLIQANSKQIFDLVDIVSELNKNREIPIKNLFDVMFVFQNFEDKKLQGNNEDFSTYEFENTTSKFPLSLISSQGEESFNFLLEYSSMEFTKNDIELLIAQFISLVKNISENLDGKIIDYIGGRTELLQVIEDDITFNF